MAIGQGGKGVLPRILHGGWQPLANYFGVRVEPVRAGKQLRP
jgi:hypothetical protein